MIYDEFEVIFVCSGEEEEFVGTAAEIAAEIYRRSMVYGTVQYKTPFKPVILLEVE